MATVYLATSNDNKVRELRELVAFHESTDSLSPQLRFERWPLSLAEEELLEIQGTAADIVRHKCVAATRILRNLTGGWGAWVLVEDTSLELDALGGFPGPYIKDFARHMSLCDIAEMCKRSGKVHGTAVCSLALAPLRSPDDDVTVFSGTCVGEIVAPVETEGAFGWDPLFRPLGSSRTFAEMTADEKNACSHRGAAVRNFVAQSTNLFSSR